MDSMKRFATEDTGRGGFGMGMVCGVALGAALGVAAGLLLAPQTGASLRQRLGKSADRLRQVADEEYARAADTVTTVVDDVIERGTHAVQRGQETLQKMRRSAESTTPQANGRPFDEHA